MTEPAPGSGPSGPADGPRRLPVPVYPILLAAFPVLHLFRTNIDEVSTGQALTPLALVVGGSLVLLALSWLALRDVRRGGLLVALFVLLFFSYGYVADAIAGWDLGGVAIGRDRYVLALWALLAVGGGYLLLRVRRSLPEVTKILNGVAAVLILTTVVPIAADKLSGATDVEAASRPSILPTRKEGPNEKRDIYYVNFDRYGGEESLQAYFDFDNRPFLGSLESKGFTVAHDAHANYPNTGHSMSSMLNMTYLDEVAKQVGPSSSDWRPLYGMIKEHEVGRFLKSQGYRYVHVGSWFEPTRTNPLADVNVKYDPLSEFSRTLLETTPLQPLSKAFGIGDDKLDPRRVAWARVLFQLEQLVQVGNDGKPTFVLAHIIMPHEPYVFERDGAFLSVGRMKERHWHRNYLEQLMFANAMMTRVADRLLAGPDASDPIIIFSSDEGPPPGSDPNQTNPDPESWISKTTRQLRQKFGILAAFYLPGIADPRIPPSITPVNFFRKVLSLYLGADLPPLADRSFVWVDKKHLYEFADVTDQVAS